MPFTLLSVHYTSNRSLFLRLFFFLSIPSLSESRTKARKTESKKLLLSTGFPSPNVTKSKPTKTMESTTLPRTYGLELQFEEGLMELVSELLQDFREKGVYCPVLEVNITPSIILIETKEKNLIRLRDFLKNWQPEANKIPISLSSLSFSIVGLGSSGSEELILKQDIFMGATATPALLSFHRDLCETLEGHSIEVEECWRPGSWIPCCQVAQYVTKPDNALKCIPVLDVPLEGRAVGVRMIQISPCDCPFDLTKNLLSPPQSPEPDPPQPSPPSSGAEN